MFKRGFVSLYVRAAVGSVFSPLCSVTDGAFLPRAASSGLKRFVSLCVRAAVSSAISPFCSVTDGALLPRAASSGLNAAWGVICPGGGQQRDFAALFRCRRCISTLVGIFRFKAVCVVMCSGGGQQRDFAILFRYRRCASSSGGIFRFKRGLGRYMSGRRSAARFRRFVPLPTVHFYPGRHLPI